MLLAVIALAVALPVALHRHELSADTSSSSSTAGQRQSASTASAAAPSGSSVPVAAPLTSAQEFSHIKARRRVAFAQGIDAWRVAAVPSWLATQKPDGSWPDIDYTSGCAAQRANWPAQEHLTRTLALAAMASGLGMNATALTTTRAVGSAASSALDWWFAADFGGNLDCLAQGGNPCVSSLREPDWPSQLTSLPLSGLALARAAREGFGTATGSPTRYAGRGSSHPSASCSTTTSHRRSRSHATGSSGARTTSRRRLCRPTARRRAPISSTCVCPSRPPHCFLTEATSAI